MNLTCILHIFLILMHCNTIGRTSSTLQYKYNAAPYSHRVFYGSTSGEDADVICYMKPQ